MLNGNALNVIKLRVDRQHEDRDMITLSCLLLHLEQAISEKLDQHDRQPAPTTASIVEFDTFSRLIKHMDLRQMKALLLTAEAILVGFAHLQSKLEAIEEALMNPCRDIEVDEDQGEIVPLRSGT